MLSVPPSVFYGKRTTRAQAKVEPVCTRARKNPATTGTSKIKATQDAKAGSSQETDSSSRQLRSAPSKSSKKASEAVGSIDAASTAASSASSVLKTQRTLRTRRNATNDNPDESSSKPTRKPVVVPTPVKKPGSEIVKTPLPVYKQAILEPPVLKKFKASASDEYEFESETPEGNSKKSKRKKPRQRIKTQTLWGMNVKTAAKPKSKLSKRVPIQECENTNVVSKVTQVGTGTKDSLPSDKKTPPLQERPGNTVHNNIPSLCESQKKDNFGYLLRETEEDSASESMSKQLTLKTRQANEEAKENNPVVKKGVGPVMLPTSCKERDVHLSKCSISQTERPSMVSSVRSCGPTPLAPNSMPAMFSPICGTALSPNHSAGQLHQRKGIHASTPVVSRTKKNGTGSDTSTLNAFSPTMRKSLMTATTCSMEASPECMSTAENPSPKPHGDSVDHHSSFTGSDYEDSQDLFDPDILQDVCNGAKPSIPNRLLGSRKPTMFRGSKLSQVNEIQRQGTDQIVPVDTIDSCWRIGPTTKYVYSYEPTFDNCFGFDSGPDACSVNVEPVKQFAGRKVPYTAPVRLPSPILQKQMNQSQPQDPVPQPQKSCPHPESKPAPTFKEPTTLLTDGRIDEMLSRSLSRLRSKKQQLNDSTIFDSISSTEDTEESASSQPSVALEGSMNSSEQPPPLFEDIEDNLFKSSFSQPPRRSYAHVRPSRSLYQEDDENEEPEDKRSKASKSYKTVHKRKKMVQTTLLNQWAKDLSSHFAEVDDIELITE